jgi:hypothetical protein
MRNRTDNIQTFDATAAYAVSLGGHSLHLLTGLSEQKQLIADEQADSVQVGSVLSTYRYYKSEIGFKIKSLFGRFTYDFKSKYLFTASLRQDRSPWFNQSSSPQYFPAYEIGWRVKNEAFFKDFTWLTELKIRAGYGITGRQLDLYQPTGFTSNRLPNPGLHGEKLTESNMGLDLGLFSNRLLVQLDHYRRLTHSLLIHQTLSYGSGGTISFTNNMGQLSNRGWEILVKARPVASSKLNWNTTFNISFNQNELLFDVYTYRGALTKGQPVGAMYGYKVAAFRQDSVVFNGVYFYNRLGQPAKYYDLDRDKDQVLLGNGSPKTYIGFSNTVTFGRFDVTAHVRGALRFYIRNYHRYENINPGMGWNMLSEVHKLYGNVLINRDLLRDSDFFVEKGDYLKIDNLIVGYTLPQKNRYIQSIRFYLSGNNLFTFTQFKGMDPEMAGISSSEPGKFSDYTYPVARVYSLGANLIF